MAGPVVIGGCGRRAIISTTSRTSLRAARFTRMVVVTASDVMTAPCGPLYG